MSAKDVIVGVLKPYISAIGSYVSDKEKERLCKEIAQQILDSLPRLDRDKVEEIVKNAWDNRRFGCGDIEEIINNNVIDQICSLIPAGEVVATGEVEVYCDEYEGDVTRIGDTELHEHFWNHKGEKGTLIWVPDKEVEDDK